MQLSDLIGAEDLDRFKEHRRQAYSLRAAGFLARHFPRAIASLSAEGLDLAIRDAAEEARQFGLVSESDNLSFLVARVMLGRRFVLNPLYLDLLYAAGWVDDDGQPARHFAFAPLFAEIEAWDRIRSADLASTRRLVTGFARLYDGDAPDDRQIEAVLHQLFPASAQAVRPELLTAFAQVAERNAQQAQLGGADLRAFCAAALILGGEMQDDPFLGGIGQALAAHPAGSGERRLAFGMALRQILLGRLGMEEDHGA